MSALACSRTGCQLILQTQWIIHCWRLRTVADRLKPRLCDTIARPTSSTSSVMHTLPFSETCLSGLRTTAQVCPRYQHRHQHSYCLLPNETALTIPSIQFRHWYLPVGVHSQCGYDHRHNDEHEWQCPALTLGLTWYLVSGLALEQGARFSTTRMTFTSSSARIRGRIV